MWGAVHELFLENRTSVLGTFSVESNGCVMVRGLPKRGVLESHVCISAEQAVAMPTKREHGERAGGGGRAGVSDV